MTTIERAQEESENESFLEWRKSIVCKIVERAVVQCAYRAWCTLHTLQWLCKNWPLADVTSVEIRICHSVCIEAAA